MGLLVENLISFLCCFFAFISAVGEFLFVIGSVFLLVAIIGLRNVLGAHLEKAHS